MPFDGVTLEKMEIQQRRRTLLAELRGSQPNWDFRSGEHCAIGIACHLFGNKLFMSANDVAKSLGIPGHLGVFTNTNGYGVYHLDKVTPLMVADRLEDLFSYVDSRLINGS